MFLPGNPQMSVGLAPCFTAQHMSPGCADLCQVKKTSFSIEAILSKTSQELPRKISEAQWKPLPVSMLQMPVSTGLCWHSAYSPRFSPYPSVYSIPEALQQVDDTAERMHRKELQWKKEPCPRRTEDNSLSRCKRYRTIFTQEQLERLEQEFVHQHYLIGPQRLLLATALRLTDTQVKVWFQNRRTKWRREQQEEFGILQNTTGTDQTDSPHGKGNLSTGEEEEELISVDEEDWPS